MESSAPPRPAPSIETTPHRVLVVDDSDAQRRLLSKVLLRSGLEVVTAASAEEALEICAGPEGARIRIVISDWQMPGLDGPEFCAAFRKLRGSAFAYFILVTSRTDARAKTEGLKAGADDFVTRPVDMAELRARIGTGRRILDMHEVLEHRNHEVQRNHDILQAITEAVDRDLVEARRLQQGFLPAAAHRAGASDLSLRLLTCEQIGGDLVGWFDLSETEIALYSIDVSGHGIASALMTGRLAGLFSNAPARRNFAFPEAGGRADPPHRVMERLNDFMLSQFDTDIYFTAVLAYVDLVSGTVRFCQAGHPHPLVRRADGGVERLGAGGPPVGLLPRAPFEAATARLGPGDTFLTYSDGVTECVDTWGDMLDEDGLVDLVSGARSGAGAVIDHIEEGLRAHAGIQGFVDDISMVAMLFNPPEAERRAIAAR